MIIFSYFSVFTAPITCRYHFRTPSNDFAMRVGKSHDLPKQALFSSGVFLAVKNDKMSCRTFCLLSRKLRFETAKALLTRRYVLIAARDPLLFVLDTLGKCFSLAKIAMEIFFKGARLVGKSLCNSKEKKTWWPDSSTRIHLNYLQIALLCDISLEWLEAQPSIGSRTI